MTASEWPIDVERFRSIVARRLGLHFDDGKLAFLADLLRRRAESKGEREAAYLGRLESDDGVGSELYAVAQDLTVTETYFFRHREQFQALSEIALPERMRAQSASRKLHILSAGCASGEEAYSLAILLRDRAPDSSWELSVRGVDINAAMLDRARSARYSSWSLRGTPEHFGKTWFKAHGRELVLSETVRSAVTFETRNLAGDNPDLWRPQSYDIVFCRNVLMYFEPEVAQAVVARIARALVPGGYLFLGYAETLRGLSQEFHLRHTNGAFYYQGRGGAEPQISSYAPAKTARAGATLVGADSWVDTIRRAADRIRTLSEEVAPPSITPPAEPPSELGWDLAPAIELLREERFAEALIFVRALPAASTHDPDVLLLRAVLLVHGGELARAEQACAELLVVDELNAGAHYLLALCHEGTGDRERARDHDQIAVYLDPSFAMAHLHLGLLARHTGDAQGAHRELAQALSSLQREDSSRLMLFGGGFGRAALVALCRAELTAALGAS
jgi:chemotaxis protein methyltransferase CheR